MADAVVRVGVVVIFYLMSQELEKRETRKKKLFCSEIGLVEQS